MRTNTNKGFWVIIFLISQSYFFAQTSENDFVTTWKTDNPGLLSDTVIRIPTFIGTYNYDVDWDNDGVFDEFGKTGNSQHDYGTPGTYTVRIRGQFPHFYINNDPNMREKLLSVDQWGNIQWSSMSSSFRGAVNTVINASDTPDLSNVINMSSMFNGASSINQNLNNWDVGNIEVMRFLFNNTSFNQPLDNWDVSNVRDMQAMFQNNSSFNQPIAMWNVGNVETFSDMFKYAINFNQPLGDWNTTNATDMRNMFSNATSFNQNIDTWDVGNVEDMYQMFFLAISYDQPLNSWNVANVQNMERMFNNADLFNQPLDNWDVGNVITMHRMFTQTSFDQDISNWNVSNVTNMAFMFQGLTLSTENYDAILNSWSSQTLQPNVEFHGGYSNYCSSDIARNSIINIYGWTITDGGLDCSGLSIDEFENNNLKFHPNPTKDYLYIDYDNISTIEIFSLKGKSIKVIKPKTSKIDLTMLPTGIYILKFLFNNQFITKKLIKE